MSSSVTFTFNLNVEIPNLNGDMFRLDVSLGEPQFTQHEVPSMVVFDLENPRVVQQIPAIIQEAVYMIPESVATGRDIVPRTTDMPRGWRPNDIIWDDYSVCPPKQKTNWLKEGF